MEVRNRADDECFSRYWIQLREIEPVSQLLIGCAVVTSSLHIAFLITTEIYFLLRLDVTWAAGEQQLHLMSPPSRIQAERLLLSW